MRGLFSLVLVVGCASTRGIGIGEEHEAAVPVADAEADLGTSDTGDPSDAAADEFAVALMRVGDGLSPLPVDATAAAFVEVRGYPSGRLVREIGLPTTTGPDTPACTIDPSNLEEGRLSPSADGARLAFGCHDAPPGVTAPELDRGVRRVLALLDGAGAVQRQRFPQGPTEGPVRIERVDLDPTTSYFFVTGSIGGHAVSRVRIATGERVDAVPGEDLSRSRLIAGSVLEWLTPGTGQVARLTEVLTGGTPRRSVTELPFRAIAFTTTATGTRYLVPFQATRIVRQTGAEIVDLAFPGNQLREVESAVDRLGRRWILVLSLDRAWVISTSGAVVEVARAARFTQWRGIAIAP